MNLDINLESVKKEILNFLELDGTDIKMLDSKYDSNFNINWDEAFFKKYTGVIDAIKILKESTRENDKNAQKCALMLARMMSLSLLNFFENLFEDIEKIYYSKVDEWPKLPEGYKVPEKFCPEGNSLRNIACK